MVILGLQYNIENCAVYGKDGKEIKGVSEVVTPTIWDCPGGDTTVRSMPYRYKYRADKKTERGK